MIYYDYLILTNGPGFYKVALFNELSKLYKIKVIFQSATSDIRSAGHCVNNFDFDFEIISNRSFEKRNKVSSFLKTINIIRKTKYHTILHSGWESVELIPLAFILPRKKNGIVIESSIIETKKSGLIWLIKKAIIKNMTYAFPSGKLQNDILRMAGFSGKVHITHGVGLPKLPESSRDASKKCDDNNFTYLFVGRLSPEKNIIKLIEIFKKTNRKLTIVGDGPLRQYVESQSDELINYLGYIENSNLSAVYNTHHCFILPSTSEPWGLVVEEALMHKIPVVISNNIGCKFDLVDRFNSGTSFEIGNDDSFIQALLHMERDYNLYLENVAAIDFSSYRQMKIDAYAIERD